VASLRLVPELLIPKLIGVIRLDDVITNGTTFKAAQRILGAAVPDVKLIGLFVGDGDRQSRDGDGQSRSRGRRRESATGPE
jgi:hypothetical protein